MTPVRRGAQFVLVGLGAVSMARLAPGGRGIVAYLAVSAVGAVVALLAARRLPAVAAWDLGALAVVVATVVAAEPSKSWFGVPTPGAVSATLHALAHTGGLHFPARPTAGVIAAGALVAGVAAAATVVTRGGWSALPSLALATWSIVALPSVGAALLGLGVLAAAATLVLETAASPSGWYVTAGSLAAGACCLLALGSSPGIALGSSPGGQPGGSGGASVHVNASTLLDDVPGIEAHDANAVMFTARTPVPTYWQVATLSTLSPSDVWQPDAATSTVLAGARASTTRGTFRAQVTVDGLVSLLLAVPPGTVSVPGATVTPQGVVAAGPVAPGDQYVAVAQRPPYVPPTATVTADPADLALPPQPPAVVELANAVTASAPTPVQKAEALVDWFRSNAFRYSLRAKPSLVDFLTTSRVGSCQQFAGAFALLAREVGLPTRVAIGFTGGRLATTGETVVRGADAHAWPQVLLDGDWVSFEPTPQQPGGGLSPPGVLGPGGLGNPNPTGPVKVPTNVHPPPVTAPTTVMPVPGHAPALPAASPLPWLILGGSVVVAVVAAGAVIGRRRKRARRDPRDRIVGSWQRVDRGLARAGLGRPPARTPSTHLDEMRGAIPPSAFADMRTVADVLERTAYAGTPLTAREGDEVEAAARRAVRGARTGRSTSPV